MPASKFLAEAIQQAVASNEMLEGAFSRNRSFGQKGEEVWKICAQGSARVMLQIVLDLQMR